MKKQLTLLMGCALLLFACNKNELQHPITPVQLNYKIQPKKIGEFKNLAEIKNSGGNFRISEEILKEEEFWLYTEAVVNSLITDMVELPDETHERIISYIHEGEFNSTGLINAITSIQQSIEQDLEQVAFETVGTPYVHIVDVQWNTNENEVAVLYIAGITSNNIIPPGNTWQMSMHPNSSCSDYALNGQMQRLMYAHWNGQSTPAGKFRPNYLFSPPLWNENYIPCCWTYTEVETITIDFAEEDQRIYYSVPGPYVTLWHRTTYGLNNPPACLPDVVNTWPRTIFSHARGTADLGIGLNPNAYFLPSNPNGLVLVGFNIEWKSGVSSLAPLSIPNSLSNQKEDWHKVSYTYGRQISTNAPNL